MPNNLLTFLPHVSMATLLSTTVARLTLSAALGGIIGLEREFKHRPAGLRTNMFICFGAAMFTILSEQLVGDSAGEHTRIASQIIPGIGFIGAGSILHAKGSVTGLTTAATIFVVASIGMACGGGLYLVALFATLLILMALQALGWLERRLNLKPLVMNYSLVTSKSAEEMVTEVNSLLENLDLTMRGIRLSKIGDLQKLVCMVDGTRSEHKQLIEQLRQSVGLQSFEAAPGVEREL
jgi:putative Mg2+ transporter-C (MgtC) family protein